MPSQPLRLYQGEYVLSRFSNATVNNNSEEFHKKYHRLSLSRQVHNDEYKGHQQDKSD